MYQIGEHIMYKNIGICVVEEIGKPGFSADKDKEYYTLRPLDATGNARIYVPVDYAEYHYKKRSLYLFKRARIHGSGSLLRQ